RARHARRLERDFDCAEAQAISGRAVSAIGEPLMTVDYVANCFLPDRRAVWEQSIARAGLQVKVRSDDSDSFAEPAQMVERMDELGISTLLLSTCDIGAHGQLDPLDFEHVATRWAEIEAMVSRWPGRFAALVVVKPATGMAG